MRYPQFLPENGRIGFIAPSFGCTTEPYATLFNIAIESFNKNGYKTVLGPNCFKDDGIGKSTSKEACGAEVNDFFTEDKCDIIISCGGGELMCEDLPYIDFDALKRAKAKWYMGFSDNTNLIFLLNTICDTAAVYGPNAPKFGTDPMHKCVTDSFEILTGKRTSVSNYDGWFLEDEESYTIVPYKQTICDGYDFSKEVSFKGRLIGGCMDCLVNLCGTSFDKVANFNERYAKDGIIWYLEACDLNVMGIRRALWQMENAGWFQNVKGFIIGRPMHYDDVFGEFDHIEAARGILDKYNVPIVMDIDLGHLFPMMPIVSGAIATVKAKENEISLDYDFE